MQENIQEEESKEGEDLNYMFHMVDPLFSGLVAEMIEKKPEDPVQTSFSLQNLKIFFRLYTLSNGSRSTSSNVPRVILTKKGNQFYFLKTKTSFLSFIKTLLKILISQSRKTKKNTCQAQALLLKIISTKKKLTNNFP